MLNWLCDTFRRRVPLEMTAEGESLLERAAGLDELER